MDVASVAFPGSHPASVPCYWPTLSIPELLPPAELCRATCPSMVSKDTGHPAQLRCHIPSPLLCQLLLGSVLLTPLLAFLSQPSPPGTAQGLSPCTARQKLRSLCSSPSPPSPALIVLTLWRQLSHTYPRASTGQRDFCWSTSAQVCLDKDGKDFAAAQAQPTSPSVSAWSHRGSFSC